MFGKMGSIACISFVVLMLIGMSSSNPVIDTAGEYEVLNLCLRNCGQCKKMYGSYFEGQLCADGCIKFKGKNFIPDCEDIGSIAPFLNKF